MNINTLLEMCQTHQASDLHLSAEQLPLMRVDGKLRSIQLEPLSHDAIIDILKTTMTAEQFKQFQEELEIDYAFAPTPDTRFRINAFHHQHGAAAALRIITSEPPQLEDLDAPQFIHKVADLKQGLVIVTGPTGSGKSTTLAAIVDQINKKHRHHIVTIEDPIEYVHNSNQALINQREVGQNTKSFPQALRSALREDPDVILVGEMRDLESIRLAITAAETGHLVLSTLHTNSAAEAISRIIQVFPSSEQELIRTMVSSSLAGIISQRLIPKKGGGRVAAYEILVSTPAVRNLIRENKIAQLVSSMQTGARDGMLTLDQHLKQLREQNIIEPELSLA